MTEPKYGKYQAFIDAYEALKENPLDTDKYIKAQEEANKLKDNDSRRNSQTGERG